MERRRLREALPEGEARWAAVRLGKAPGGAPRGPATDLTFIGCPAARTTGGSAGRPARALRSRRLRSAAATGAPLCRLRRGPLPTVKLEPRAPAAPRLRSRTASPGEGASLGPGRGGSRRAPAVRNGAAPLLLPSLTPPGGRLRSRCHGGQSRAVPGYGTPLGLPCPARPGREKADKLGGISGPE